MGIVAGAIGVEERRREAEQALASQARDLAGLYNVALMTGSVLDRDALLQRLFEQLQSLIRFDSFVVAMYDHEHEEIEWVMAMEDGSPVTDVTGTRSPMAEGWLTGWVMRNRRPLLVHDVSIDPLPAAARFDGGPTRSWLGVPLLAHSRLVGALSVQSYLTGAFDESNQRLLELLAAQVAVALENSRLYEEVRNHAQEMEQHVAARTAELQRANEKLRELDRLKSQFVSNVSHELRTPLTNIKLYLGLLDSGKPEKRERYMGTLAREVDLLHHLIEGLLNLSRLDLGQVQPELQEVDPNALITTLVADRAALAAERGLTLDQELAAALPHVMGDEKMLLQVLTNLIGNAVNYTPPGGRVAVSTATTVDQGRQWVLVSVSDTGPGVQPEERELIFDRFYRGSAAISGGVAGTGLGLSISKELVALLNGQITLETPQAGGCCFTIRLPAAPVAAGEPWQSPAAPATANG